jgi:flagellar protein FliS
LGAGINYEAGIIADQLEVIYQYLADRIIQANINKDTQIVEECLRIVSILKEAWQIAMSKTADQTSMARLSKTLAYETSYESLTVDVKE